MAGRRWGSSERNVGGGIREDEGKRVDPSGRRVGLVAKRKEREESGRGEGEELVERKGREGDGSGARGEGDEEGRRHGGYEEGEWGAAGSNRGLEMRVEGDEVVGVGVREVIEAGDSPEDREVFVMGFGTVGFGRLSVGRRNRGGWGTDAGLSEEVTVAGDSPEADDGESSRSGEREREARFFGRKASGGADRRLKRKGKRVSRSFTRPAGLPCMMRVDASGGKRWWRWKIARFSF